MKFISKKVIKSYIFDTYIGYFFNEMPYICKEECLNKLLSLLRFGAQRGAKIAARSLLKIFHKISFKPVACLYIDQLTSSNLRSIHYGKPNVSYIKSN